MASTHSVNNSREPVRVTRISSQGTTRVPTTSASATNSATLPSVITSASQVLDEVPGACTMLVSPPSVRASAGSITSASTMARSSTISQPTAIFPSEDCNALRSSSARSSTTVLATDSDNPNTRPLPKLQPSMCAMPAPMAVAVMICASAPGSAMWRTDEQVLDGEMQPDAEHQQDDADFGELAGQAAVADESGSKGTHGDAGQQIADDGRDPQHVGRQPQQQCKDEADGQQGNQRSFV